MTPGFVTGDPEWERRHLRNTITRRASRQSRVARLTGETNQWRLQVHRRVPDGRWFEENVEFFELTCEDVQQVDADRAFEAIAPLLWLRAGGQGRSCTRLGIRRVDGCRMRSASATPSCSTLTVGGRSWRSCRHRVGRVRGERLLLNVHDSVEGAAAGGRGGAAVPRNYLSTFFEIGRLGRGDGSDELRAARLPARGGHRVLGRLGKTLGVAGRAVASHLARCVRQAAHRHRPPRPWRCLIL